ncbi:MAG: 1-acyl-sn-glycerol-3-phosphate acyltransferase [Oscillospiraceae bacterium]|nr:1-acyl-sn-glycerol-3-phosphate acyltransferase [Oscillospiraceae bacterium]
MIFYFILFTSVFVAASSVAVYGFIDKWYWPWLAILIFTSVFALCVLAFLAYCTLLSFFVDINRPLKKQSRYFYHLLSQVAYLLMRILRIKIHFSGKEYMPEDSKFLFVCNHLAWIDPGVALIYFKKHHLSFISKKETFSYPVANKFLYKTACLAIDRENDREALKTINKAAEYIQNGVCSIGIYPEGWVSKSGELLEFRHGAFRIAKKAGCPIIVAHLSGTDYALKKPFWKKCDVYFEIKGVVPVEYIREHKTAEISELAREIMIK